MNGGTKVTDINEQWVAAKADLDDAIAAAIKAGGWEVARRQKAGTGSVYLDLTRNDETITVRIADHGGAHWRPTDVELIYAWPGSHTANHNERELAKISG